MAQKGQSGNSCAIWNRDGANEPKWELSWHKRAKVGTAKQAYWESLRITLESMPFYLRVCCEVPTPLAGGLSRSFPIWQVCAIWILFRARIPTLGVLRHTSSEDPRHDRLLPRTRAALRMAEDNLPPSSYHSEEGCLSRKRGTRLRSRDRVAQATFAAPRKCP